MSSWSLLEGLRCVHGGDVLFDIHRLEVSIHSLLLDQGHGIERDLLCSEIIIAPSTMPQLQSVYTFKQMILEITPRKVQALGF